MRFQVARMADGDDPAFLVVKTLAVDYAVDGRPFTATGQDPQEVELLPPPRTARPTSSALTTGHCRFRPARRAATS